MEALSQIGLSIHGGLGMERTCVFCRGGDGKEVPKEVRDLCMRFTPGTCGSMFRHQQKIRGAFNPNDLGDSYYVTL